MNLAPTWAARLRQWWDELFTGRAERALLAQADEWKNEAYRWRAKCEQMEKALMLATPNGAAYIRSQSAPRQADKPAAIAVPHTWADMQAAEWETPDEFPVRSESAKTQQQAADEGRVGIGR